MARQDNKIHTPGVFGGLMRYDEEYGSRFMLTPGQVIVFIVFVTVFIVFLKILFPIAGLNFDGTSGPVQGGLILGLLASWKSRKIA